MWGFQRELGEIPPASREPKGNEPRAARSSALAFDNPFIVKREGALLPDERDALEKHLPKELSFTPENYRHLLAGAKDQERPGKIMEALSKDLRALYNMQTGTVERETLLKHTERVLGQYEKYFATGAGTEKVRPALYRGLLALHDLGKPIAVKMKRADKQHVMTAHAVSELFPKMGFDDHDTNLAFELVQDDSLGSYLQSTERKLNERLSLAAERVRQAASSTDMPVEDFLRAKLVYFMSDASAYSSDAGSSHMLDHVFHLEDGKVMLDENGLLKLSSAYKKRLAVLYDRLGVERPEAEVSEKHRIDYEELQQMMEDFVLDQKDRREKEGRIDPLDREEANEIIETFMESGIFPQVTVPREHLKSIMSKGLIERPTAYQKHVSAIVGTLGRKPHLPEKDERAILELHVPPELVTPRFTGKEKVFQGVVRINMRRIPPEQISVLGG